MLTIWSPESHRDCAGTNRRNFLKAGSLGLGGLALPQLLSARAQAAQSGQATKDSAVIWLWLSGGPTHVETFDPKMTAPSEYRSMLGEVATTVPGVTLGASFPKLAARFDQMAVVRSFAHSNSGHAGGTHFVMTGYDNRMIDNGGLPTRPSIGAVAAKVRGPNHYQSGMPTYVRLGSIGTDGPAFLGPAYAPFDPSGPARKNLTLQAEVDRVDDRRALLGELDRFRRDADQSGLMTGLDAFESQAFDLLLGSAPEAFNVEKEDEATRKRYGKEPLALQLLAARRLVEAGCGFVTLNYGGWDMHSGLARSMGQRAPVLDQAVAALLDDLKYRGLTEKVLLVITGEFGRTPRINRNAGRDHWAPLSTLALAGGGFRMGQTIGESAPKADVPATRPIRPQDLMATVLHHLGIDQGTHFINQAGRPVSVLEGGSPIAELL